MRRTDQEILLAGVEAARRVLGEYIAPGPREAITTVEQIMRALDDDIFIAALDRLHGRMTIRLVEVEPESSEI